MEPDFGISQEIESSVKKVRKLVSEAIKSSGESVHDSVVEYGYYRTHLRMSLVIIDDRFCYAILCYSPKRTSEALALLFDTQGVANEGAPQHIIEHFDAVFKQLKEDGHIEQIHGRRVE